MFYFFISFIKYRNVGIVFVKTEDFSVVFKMQLLALTSPIN